jgi:putative FmdB family regulatory protein
MPIYAYKCEKCEEEFEAIQKMSAEPLKKHKDCGGKLEKLLSLPSFRLEGGGWYKDGYSKNESGSGVAKKTRDRLTGSGSD